MKIEQKVTTQSTINDSKILSIAASECALLMVVETSTIKILADVPTVIPPASIVVAVPAEVTVGLNRVYWNLIVESASMVDVF